MVVEVAETVLAFLVMSAEEPETESSSLSLSGSYFYRMDDLIIVCFYSQHKYWCKASKEILINHSTRK